MSLKRQPRSLAKQKFRVAHAAARRIIANQIDPEMMRSALVTVQQPTLPAVGNIEMTTIRTLLSIHPDLWEAYKLGVQARFGQGNHRPPLPLPG